MIRSPSVLIDLQISLVPFGLAVFDLGGFNSHRFELAPATKVPERTFKNSRIRKQRNIVTLDQGFLEPLYGLKLARYSYEEKGAR